MKLKSMNIIVCLLGLSVLISCSDSPSTRDIEKLAFLQVMTGYIPTHEGIETEGRLNTSAFTNPAMQTLGYGMKFFRIDTLKVPVKVKSVGEKQEDGTWLALIEVTIDGIQYVAPTRVYYDEAGKLQSSMISR